MIIWEEFAKAKQLIKKEIHLLIPCFTTLKHSSIHLKLFGAVLTTYIWDLFLAFQLQVINRPLCAGFCARASVYVRYRLLASFRTISHFNWRQLTAVRHPRANPLHTTHNLIYLPGPLPAQRLYSLKGVGNQRNCSSSLQIFIVACRLPLASQVCFSPQHCFSSIVIYCT